jgi:hypothetical protein
MAWPGRSTISGIEVGTPEEVQAATSRLSGEGLDPDVQESTTCCYAVQDKAWVNDPDGAPWEVYTVLADAPTRPGWAAPPRPAPPSRSPSPSGTSRSCC